MTRRRTFGALALGSLLVGVGVSLWRGRSDATRRPHTRTRPALRLALLVSLLWPWDGVVGIFTSIATDVKEFVVEMLNAAMTALYSAWGWLSDRVNDLWSRVWGFVGDVAQLGYRLITLIDDATEALWGKVNGLAEALWDIAYTAARTVFHELIEPVINQFVDIARAVLGEIFGEALDFLTDPIGYVWRAVEGFVQAMIDAALAGFGGIVDIEELIRSLVTGVLQEIFGDAWSLFVDFLELLPKVWDFLWFIATHPFTWFDDAAKAVLEDGPDWVVAHILDAIDGAENQAGAAFERWAGT